MHCSYSPTKDVQVAVMGFLTLTKSFLTCPNEDLIVETEIIIKRMCCREVEVYRSTVKP